jgi:hypothetical protein
VGGLSPRVYSGSEKFVEAIKASYLPAVPYKEMPQQKKAERSADFKIQRPPPPGQSRERTTRTNEIKNRVWHLCGL